MRVLIAPDKFAGTLDAVQAANAIAAGWQRWSPEDQVTLAPIADGGPGFLHVLHSVLGGSLSAMTVSGPNGDAAPASLLRHESAVYIESAQACGRHLITSDMPWTATTFGVGELLSAALETDAETIVIGLGGSATNDGGAGLLAALGATADVPLDGGPQGLIGLRHMDVSAAQARTANRNIVLASDVNIALLGMFGASKTFGPQKGFTDAEILHVDEILDHYVATLCGPTPAQRRTADAPGAGAAGGLGFALLHLGATTTSGIDLVASLTGLADQAAVCDVVVTGEGRFDYSSRSGKAVHGVAQIAAQAARPCIVLAGQVDMGSREMRALGVESAYGIVDRIGKDAAFERPFEALAQLAERVARTWSR